MSDQLYFVSLLYVLDIELMDQRYVRSISHVSLVCSLEPNQ